MPKKKPQLNYSSVDRVARWNYCQLLGKYILDSGITDEQLKNVLLEIQSGDFKLALNVEHK